MKQFEALRSAFFYGVLFCAGYEVLHNSELLRTALCLFYAPRQAYPQLIYKIGECI